MTRILQKKADELTADEKSQISALIKRYYPGAEKSYIENRVSSKCDFDIVLLKESDKILGVNYYKLNFMHTSFARKKLPVVQFGQSLKEISYKGNVIWTLGHWYGKKNIGPYYQFKKILGITITGNPKVYAHFVRMFPNNSNQTRESKKLQNFLELYIEHYTRLGHSLSPERTVEYPNLKKDNITADWTRFYQSKNELINQRFFDYGILSKEDSQIMQSSKCMVVAGFRNPLNPF